MGDFFVVRAARRQGVGHEVVEGLFTRFGGRWEIGFQGEQPRRTGVLAPGRDRRGGDGGKEERRPVPDKPHIPEDHFIVLTLDGGHA